MKETYEQTAARFRREQERMAYKEMTTRMYYSRVGYLMTEGFEACRLKAYQDTGGVWTIGFGHTKNVRPGDRCDVAQAQNWLHEDIAVSENAVNRDVLVPLNQEQFDALVDFVFNCGRQNLDASTLLRLVNVGNFAAAAAEFEKWDHVGGKVVAGLLRRRVAEEKEFLS